MDEKDFVSNPLTFFFLFSFSFLFLLFLIGSNLRPKGKLRRIEQPSSNIWVRIFLQFRSKFSIEEPSRSPLAVPVTAWWRPGPLIEMTATHKHSDTPVLRIATLSIRRTMLNDNIVIFNDTQDFLMEYSRLRITWKTFTRNPYGSSLAYYPLQTFFVNFCRETVSIFQLCCPVLQCRFETFFFSEELPQWSRIQ